MNHDTISTVVPFKGSAILTKHPQQTILNVLRMAISDSIQQPDFAQKLQQIKKKFYDRDFDGIFLIPTNLPIYTAKYVPRRALCYYEIFSTPELQNILQQSPTIYCLGAGPGSELLGIMAACCNALDNHKNVKAPVVIHSQDYADWSQILERLEHSVRYKWGISNDLIQCKFSQGDLLDITPEIEQQLQQAQLVTAMFVFNELFTDKTNAMKFVKTIIKCVPIGSYFLLVDSAGSFSTVKVGSKHYMSYMFFDTLVGKFFESVISEDSKWFRHASGLNYPLNIENMRYFLRLYRRI